MILIIRPEKETERVVKDLSERQYQFLLEPLSKIKIKDFDIRHNSENFYLISIPKVHKEFLKQYDYLSSLSLTSKELPLKLELPW